MRTFEIDSYLKSKLIETDCLVLAILWLQIPLATLILGDSIFGLWVALSISFLGLVSFKFWKGQFYNQIVNALLLLGYTFLYAMYGTNTIVSNNHIYFVLGILLLYRNWKLIFSISVLELIIEGQLYFWMNSEINDVGIFLSQEHVYTSGMLLENSVYLILFTLLFSYLAYQMNKEHKRFTIINTHFNQLLEKKTKKLIKAKKRAETYRYALDSVALVSIIDEDGNIIHSNENWRELIGFDNKDTTGSKCKILEKCIKHKDSSGKMCETLSSGQIWQDIQKEKDHNGDTVWFDLYIIPLQTNIELKDRARYLMLQFDATERVQSEKTVSKQQEQIISQSKLSALGEMAGGIAHEINNPLAIINLTLRNLRKVIAEESPDKALINSDLDDIEDTVNRMSKIIQGLKNLSRDPSSEEFCFTPIRDIINDVLSLCNDRFHNNGVFLTINADEQCLKQAIPVLRVQLSQVLLNLLTNAFDEIRDKEQRWIEIKVEDNDRHIIFRVTDSGPGISKEIRDKIFNAFYTTKPANKGTGLGLSLSKSIIKKHNGVFYLDENSKDTSFVFAIPKTRHTNLQEYFEDHKSQNDL